MHDLKMTLTFPAMHTFCRSLHICIAGLSNDFFSFLPFNSNETSQHSKFFCDDNLINFHFILVSKVVWMVYK